MSQKQYSSSPAPSRLWSFMCHITLSIFFYGVLVYFLVSHTLSLMHYHIPVTRMFVSKFLECPTQVFEECGLEYPLPHDNLVRTWHLGFEPIWSNPSTSPIWVSLPPPPPAPGKWKFGQDSALGIWVGLEYPHLPLQTYVGASVETNLCIPQGYRFVCMVCKSTKYKFKTVVDFKTLSITCLRAGNSDNSDFLKGLS